MTSTLVFAFILASLPVMSYIIGKNAWGMANATVDEWAGGHIVVRIMNLIFVALAVGLLVLSLYVTFQVWGVVLFGGVLSS